MCLCLWVLVCLYVNVVGGSCCYLIHYFRSENHCCFVVVLFCFSFPFSYFLFAVLPRVSSITVTRAGSRFFLHAEAGVLTGVVQTRVILFLAVYSTITWNNSTLGYEQFDRCGLSEGAGNLGYKQFDNCGLSEGAGNLSYKQFSKCVSY